MEIMQIDYKNRKRRKNRKKEIRKEGKERGREEIGRKERVCRVRV